jgi:hypothetical protein
VVRRRAPIRQEANSDFGPLDRFRRFRRPVHNPVARYFTNVVHYIAAAHPSRLPRRNENGLMLNRFRNIVSYFRVCARWGRFPTCPLGFVSYFSSVCHDRPSWVRFVVSRDSRRPWVRFVVSRDGRSPWVRFVNSWRALSLQRSVYEIPVGWCQVPPNGVPTGTVISVFWGASIVGCR